MGGLLCLTGCGKKAPTRPFITATTRGPATSNSSLVTTPPAATTTGPAGATTGTANVVLPATFTVKPGGQLSPPTVSAPGSVPVLLTVVSGDGRAHQVTVRVPPRPRTLQVPASGRASVRLEHLPVGSFTIVLDGTVLGRLITGVKPGP